ncbi:MAG TPA: phosphotransferase family protein [Candidatus Binatia bacterium]|nr:phosphotransferase family protein [Candidatus Binatia bacterium]
MRSESPTAQTPEGTEGDVGRVLATFIAKQGFDHVVVENLVRVGGGTTQRLWSFEAVLEKRGCVERQALIARGDPPGSHLDRISRSAELQVLRAVRQAGVAVPEALWCSSDSLLLGSPFLIMKRVDGETAPGPLLRGEKYARARQAAPRELAAALARLHRLDVAAYGLGALPQMGESPALGSVLRYQGLFRRDALEPRPVLEVGFRWLLANVPPTSRSGLVHGDFRVGNFVYGPEGIRAILDWELAHVGDPLEDISWVSLRTWRFGLDEREVGGLCRLEDFLEEYEKAGGPPVDRGALRFWQVFANLRWAVITIQQARNHLDGYLRDVELASIGRRAAENELDLLDLIEEG